MSVLDLIKDDQAASSQQPQESTATKRVPTTGNNRNSNNPQRGTGVGLYDVLCGRDKLAFNNIGNRRMRVFVEIHLQQYLDATSRHEKSYIIKTVADTVRSSGGRFLKWSNEEQCYIELSEKKAHEKCSHAFRDMVTSRQNTRNNPNLPKQFRSLSLPSNSPGVSKASSPLQRAKSEDMKNSPPSLSLNSPVRATGRIIQPKRSLYERQQRAMATMMQKQDKLPSVVETQRESRLSDHSSDSSSNWCILKGQQTMQRQEPTQATASLPTAADLAIEMFGDEESDEEREMLIDIMRDTRLPIE